MPRGVGQSRVSLNRVGEREEGVNDDRRREASLITSAMLGSAIAGMCMVTCGQGSWGMSGWDVRGE